MRLSIRKDSAIRSFLGVVPVSVAATIALLCGAMTGDGSIHAATLTVTTTADNGAGSLRAAIAAAADGDSIQFDPALNGQTISLTGGELVIDKNITINGPGPNLLTVSRVSAASPFRIFGIISGHPVIAGLTISGGVAGGGGWHCQWRDIDDQRLYCVE